MKSHSTCLPRSPCLALTTRCHFGRPADATGLATGRYSYSIAVTADYSTPATTTYTGNVDIINDGGTGDVFGAGWSFDQVEKLFPVTGDVILENPGGTSLWFASAGGGAYTTPARDFSTLTAR